MVLLCTSQDYHYHYYHVIHVATLLRVACWLHLSVVFQVFSQRGLPHAAILEKHTINGDNNSSLGTQMDLEDALIFLCMNTRGKQWKTMNIRESTG